MGVRIFDIYEDPLSGFDLQSKGNSSRRDRQSEPRGLSRSISKTLPALVSGVFLSACILSVLSL